MSRAPMSTCFAAYPESGKITPSRIPSGKNAKGFFFVCSHLSPVLMITIMLGNGAASPA